MLAAALVKRNSKFPVKSGSLTEHVIQFEGSFFPTPALERDDKQVRRSIFQNKKYNTKQHYNPDLGWYI